ncbi:MAG TPA: glycosyltransferase, partial [Bacteroidales bacterium]|nr:glycosyltransferase [Bacteroidales bacterium]
MPRLTANWLVVRYFSKFSIGFNISGASNAALKMATGEYIALMDNDD